MARQRHLTNAPIVEAVIDLRVRAKDGFDPGVFARLQQPLKSRFPTVQVKRSLQTSVEFKEGKPTPNPPVDLGIQGYLFHAADGLEVAQFRSDGFTFNRLRPYTSWDDIFAKALPLWRQYVEIASPEHVTRLALRYINRFQWPLAGLELSHYLTAPPTIPARLPQELQSFSVRLVLRDNAEGVTTVLTEALEPSPDPTRVDCLVDIDSSVRGEFEPNGSELERALTTLHGVKNEAFFASLTDDALEEFK